MQTHADKAEARKDPEIRAVTVDSRIPGLRLLAVGLFLVIVALHLGSAWKGRPLIRASHLGPALEYARGSIDLLRPVIVGFNATGSPTALEFPLWQGAAGLVLKLTHVSWYGWANVVSLLCFTAGLWPFYQLARQYVGERAAWWSLAFFLAQPLIVLHAGEASVDGLCLTTILWFVYFADRMIRTGKGWLWLPTTLFAVLAAVSKLPFFFTAGLCSAFILAITDARSLRSWLLLGSVGIVALAVFMLWTRHTNSLLDQAIYPYQDLRLSHSPRMVFWFFGDWHYRFNPAHWLKGGWRFLHATLGSLPLGLLLAAGLLRPGNRMPKLWLLATLFTTLIFTHLVLEHWHYYLMCAPAVALLVGSALNWLEPFLAKGIPGRWIQTGLAGAVLMFSLVDGLIAMKIGINFSDFKPRLSFIIREQTGPADKLIVFDPDDWGGEVLFRSGRKGLCVASLESLPGDGAAKGLLELLGNETDLQKLKSLGYNKLVLLSESPARFAAEAVNPGSKRRRRLYPSAISGTVDSWPVAYQSEDILIREIR